MSFSSGTTSSKLVVTQIRGHEAGSSPPSPLPYTPSLLSREEFSTSFPRRLPCVEFYCRRFCSPFVFYLGQRRQ
ncbi:unnamed protein product [Laminaria digitata]